MNLPIRMTGAKYAEGKSLAGDRSALTLPPKSKVRLQRVPSCCLDLVASREQQPSEETREVLDSSVELHEALSWSATSVKIGRAHV